MSATHQRVGELEAAHASHPGAPVSDQPQGRHRVWPWLLGLAVVVASWWIVLAEPARGPSVLSARAWDRAGRFVAQLAGAGATEPAFLDGARWGRAAGLALTTLEMSVVAAGLAGIGALATVAFAARNLGTLEGSRQRSMVGWLAFGATRGLHLLTRAVPELVWALLIVFVVRPGVLAGAIALGLHNLGVLGRLGADVIDDLDPGPLQALRSAGAGRLQVLAYGVLPQVLPQFVTFLLYRWEVIVRATALVGFVALAGLGYDLRLDLSFRRWTSVTLLLAVYVLLVWLVDLLSAGLRRLAR